MVRWLVADVGVDPCGDGDGLVRDGGTELLSTCLIQRVTDHRRLLLVVVAQDHSYPLDVACLRGHFDVARWLITEGRVDLTVVSVVRVSQCVLPLTVWSLIVCCMCAGRREGDGGGVRGQLHGCCAMASGGGSRSDGSGGAVGWLCALSEHH
jgi:hypothetical protein